MFLRITVTSGVLILGLAIFGTTAATALAQQPETNNAAPGVQQPRRDPGRRTMRRRARLGIFRVLRQLNLSDEQKQQAHSIIRTQMESTKAERQELRQLILQKRQGTLTPEGLARARELRVQLAKSRKATRTQLAAILTPEQKMRLDEIRRTRRANHDRLGGRNQISN